MPSPKLKINIALTPRQREMYESSARILWIGTGTKTGKSTVLALSLLDGMLEGQATALVGPWFARTRAIFGVLQNLAAPLIGRGVISVTEGALRMRCPSTGGSVDCYSGDNPQGVYGANLDCVAVDEASRQPEAIWPAVCTAVSATGGKIRAAFNLELGARNWAVRNLLRVQAMTPAERQAAGEDFMTMPTDIALVSPALIESMKSQMPAQLWEALYLGKIPTSDSSLFRNLDLIFNGKELDAPLPGHRYSGGVDLGRKMDYTVVTVIDSRTGAIVAGERFTEISWKVQCERVAALTKRFGCSKVYVDCTGLGDPVAEQLQNLGVPVEPFIFTAPSRKALIEKLILAVDNQQISLPSSPKFAVYKNEMESFEYVLDGSTVKYAAPPSMHDDCVLSLALALVAFKAGAKSTLGVVELSKRIGTLGPYLFVLPSSANPTPSSTSTTTFAHAPFHEPMQCPECHATCIQVCSGRNRCSECGNLWGSVYVASPITRGDVLSGRHRAAQFKYPGQR